MEQIPVKTIVRAGLERYGRKAHVIRVDFADGQSILCQLDKMGTLMRQTHTQYEIFPFEAMVGCELAPMTLKPICLFDTSIPLVYRKGATRRRHHNERD